MGQGDSKVTDHRRLPGGGRLQPLRVGFKIHYDVRSFFVHLLRSECALLTDARYFMGRDLNEEGVDVPANTKLSDMDKAYMIINYGRPKPHRSAPLWTLERALKVAQVDSATANSILRVQDDPAQVRKMFMAYQSSKRALHSIHSGPTRKVHLSTIFSLLTSFLRQGRQMVRIGRTNSEHPYGCSARGNRKQQPALACA
jgi:hypothetical protein